MAETRINGQTFRCEPLNSWEAFDLLTVLMKLAGPALPHVLTAFRGHAEEAGLRAISDTLITMEPDLLKGFTSSLLGICEVKEDGETAYMKVIPEINFGTDLQGMIECAIWAGEVQFAGFFTGLLRSELWKNMATVAMSSVVSDQT